MSRHITQILVFGEQIKHPCRKVWESSGWYLYRIRNKKEIILMNYRWVTFQAIVIAQWLKLHKVSGYYRYTNKIFILVPFTWFTHLASGRRTRFFLLAHVTKQSFFSAIHTLKANRGFWQRPYPVVCSRWRFFAFPGTWLEVFLIGYFIILCQIKPPWPSAIHYTIFLARVIRIVKKDTGYRLH